MRVRSLYGSQVRPGGGKPRQPAGRSAALADKGHDRSRSRAKAGKARQVFKERDLAALFSNMATLLHSGVPLIKALQTLSMDETLDKAVPILEAVVDDIRAGSSFSDALAEHPHCFSPMVVSLIRAGEASGTVVAALERIADGIERRVETRNEIKHALTYPTIVVVLGGGAVGFLMAFVVPVFEETYAKAGMTLPLVTRVMIAISGVVSKTWWAMLIILVSGGLLYRRYQSHPRVRSVQDRLLIRLPLLGPMVCSIMVGRFVEAFGSLLSAGVSIKESLALTEKVVNHSEYAAMVRELRLAVSRGEGIGDKLGEYRSLISPLLVQMISLGEKNGELGNMATEISRYVGKDLKRRTQQMSSLIEPIVTVGMAFAIGTIALAIYLPIFDMFKQV